MWYEVRIRKNKRKMGREGEAKKPRFLEAFLHRCAYNLLSCGSSIAENSPLPEGLGEVNGRSACLVCSYLLCLLRRHFGSNGSSGGTNPDRLDIYKLADTKGREFTSVATMFDSPKR